jgi:hypothetical protein
MLMKITGYVIIALSLIGIVYFRNYAGHSICFPTFWYALCIIFCLLGYFLSNNSMTRKQKKDSNNILQQQEKLKINGEKVMLDINFCNFKSNNFEEEIKSKDDLGVQMYDALYNSNQNYKTDEVNQTVIIYDYKIGDQIKKIVSQVFPIDVITLKSYVMNNDIILYIDRYDKSKYFFDLKK